MRVFSFVFVHTLLYLLFSSLFPLMCKILNLISIPNSTLSSVHLNNTCPLIRIPYLSQNGSCNCGRLGARADGREGAQMAVVQEQARHPGCRGGGGRGEDQAAHEAAGEEVRGGGGAEKALLPWSGEGPRG